MGAWLGQDAPSPTSSSASAASTAATPTRSTSSTTPGWTTCRARRTACRSRASRPRRRRSARRRGTDLPAWQNRERGDRRPRSLPSSPPAGARGRRSGCRRSAARSYPAVREHEEPDCGLRTPFQRDRDRIVHCKSFRRLKHKTQVFVAPEGDHYRTRLTHTLEVTQISRTVARALRLNEDLVEAIGLGHDLGHPPFGHIGEAVLDTCLRERFGARLPPLRALAAGRRRARARRRGLNLSADVRDGILCHSGRAPMPRTLEGRIVRLVDRVAYINHDIDDALRAGVLDEARAAGRGDRGARAGRLDADRHARPRPRRALRGRRRHRPGRRGRRGDGRAADVHVRARLPRARRRGARHAKIERSSGRCSTTTSSTRTRMPGRRRRRGRRPRPARDRLHRRHDRPLRTRAFELSVPSEFAS